MSSELDTEVAVALADAATKIVRGPSFKEQLLEDALVSALERRFGAAHVFARRRVGYHELPDWSPQPSAIDVGVQGDASALRIAFELKVTEIGQTFWDMLKLAASQRLPSVERGYLIVAATARSWSAGRRAGCRYFTGGVGETELVPIAELIEAYRADWRHDLSYSARPTRFPYLLEIVQVARAEVAAWPGHELRAIAVRDGPNCGYIRAENGWPAGASYTPRND